MLGCLGQAYVELGETQQAIELFEQYLAIAREIGDLRGEGTALLNMSEDMYKLSQPAQAIASAEAALAIFEQLESPHAALARQMLDDWRAQASQPDSLPSDG